MVLEESRMKRNIATGMAVLLAAACALSGCGAADAENSGCGQSTVQSLETGQEVSEEMQQEDMDTMKEIQTQRGEAGPVLILYVNGEELAVEWEDNESVDALRQLASEEAVTIEMSMYGGFEQVGSIGETLPRNDEQITTQAGDIVLYSGNQIVLFYGSNTWAYTRLGRITDRTDNELTELLGSGNAELKIEAAR
ncbi:MAG: hypothetical protein IJJ34_08265 [Clostridia bacterium]|nr:hypothetical protein [Clostridia bacterium]